MISALPKSPTLTYSHAMTTNVTPRAGSRYLWDHGDDYFDKAVKTGEPDGTWWDHGLARELGLAGVATKDQMRSTYDELLDPRTGEQMGQKLRDYPDFQTRLARELERSAPPVEPEDMARITLKAHKAHRENVHYFDVTMSPDKDWSVLHAALLHAGQDDEAQLVWDAWMTGVDAGLQHFQTHAGYSRKGHHGSIVAGRTSGEFVDAHDFVVSLWKHHTSRPVAGRCGDPQIHVHCAMLNRVLCGDGVWRTIDSRALYAVRPAAAAIAERVAQETLARTLGVRFYDRADGKGRRIVGVPDAFIDLFSSRRRAVEGPVADKIEQYMEDKGREPPAYLVTMWSQQAALDTRAKKETNPPTQEERLAQWETRVQETLDAGFTDLLTAVDIDTTGRPEGIQATFDRADVIRHAIDDVENRQTVWSRPQLQAAIERHLPTYMGISSGAEVEALLIELVTEALASNRVAALTPPAIAEVPDDLKRADGRSIFEPHDADKFSTYAQLDREERVVALAGEHGAAHVDLTDAQRAVKKTQLALEQAAFVIQVLASDRRLHTLVGPAGTGKSFTVAELSHLWHELTGGTTFGLTSAQDAVEVLLAEGLEGQGANVSKFIGVHELLDKDVKSDKLKSFVLGPQHLVIIDEAATIPTEDFARVVEIADQAGAKIVVCGDPSQLGAVGAGGLMGLLVADTPVTELEDVRRFNNAWEGAASLGVRSGDDEQVLKALIEFDKRARILGGTEDEMRQVAIDNYLADFLADRDPLLIVGTNELAAEISSVIRQRLVAEGLVEPHGLTTELDTTVGVGDLIQARKNYAYGDKPDERVINRQIFKVLGIREGEVALSKMLGRDDNGKQCWAKPIHISDWYIIHHTTSAHGSTIDAAQGRTVGIGHLSPDERMDRHAIYPGMTRGKNGNYVYQPIEKDQNPVALLADKLKADAGERSATEVMREELAAIDHLARLGPIYQELIARQHDEHYAQIVADVLGDRAVVLQADPAAPALYNLIRFADNEGYDVRAVVHEAVTSRELGSAESVAKVLHYRVEQVLKATPAPVAVSVPEPFKPTCYFDAAPQDLVSPVSQYVREIAEAMDRRKIALGVEISAAPPSWAISRLGPVPSEPLAREEWIERAAEVASFRERFTVDAADGIGATPKRGEAEKLAAWQQAYRALGSPEANDDTTKLTDGQLRERIARYDEAKQWMPPNVDSALKAAYEADRSAQLEGADRKPDELEALETVAQARQVAFDHTAEVREQRNAAVLEAMARAEASMTQEPEVEATPQQLDIDAALAQAKAAMERIEAERVAHETPEPEVAQTTDYGHELGLH